MPASVPIVERLDRAAPGLESALLFQRRRER